MTEITSHMLGSQPLATESRVGDAAAPEISVVIPHYNDLENLRKCIDLLAEQTLPGDRFEIIVADNNSRCGSSAVESVCAGRALVIPATIQGAGEARNAGVRASRGRVLAFIDSDCRPSRYWLENGAAALADSDMVGGAIEIEVADPSDPTASEAFEMVFAFNIKRYIEEENYCSSGNMFVSRRIFDAVGGFRVGVSEDKDWGRRAVAMGYCWRYAPQASVSHPARRDWDELTRKWRRLTGESYELLLEQPAGAIRWLARSWIVLISPFAHAKMVLLSPKLDRANLRFKALFILFRLRCWRFVEAHRIFFARPAQNAIDPRKS